ncbi:hypothetical protein TEA_010224 [Camellia sinensis var. sinensis]|uniref:Enoyl reductase (ER) domain-containing protein n=1 Tax=Camellia sinensis var. sinensis TaxID=542762 RepID=A0A4V3WPH9_CAMSN|nr:hypothetical protein TEA_010224 [Camellia sinensis var. sinensis]
MGNKWRKVKLTLTCLENNDDDVTVKVLYCGVCHSDLHTVKNEWGFTMYPIVPGMSHGIGSSDAWPRELLNWVKASPLGHFCFVETWLDTSITMATWAGSRAMEPLHLGSLEVSGIEDRIKGFGEIDMQGLEFKSLWAKSKPGDDSTWDNCTYVDEALFLFPSNSYMHEIVGVVTKTGKNVEKFKIGDRVGVGVIVGSCKTCEICQQDLENYCPKMVLTYNSISAEGVKTQGGYSDVMVVDQHYVLRFPDTLPADAGAPLLCAGITVYSPMKYYGMTEPGKHLGVVGLGGLGHIAVKFGKAFGLKVTVISTSLKKEAEAINKLGADSFLISTDPTAMKAAMGTMDYIIDTVSAVHSLAPLLGLLKLNGKLVTVGLPDKPLELPIFPLCLGRKLVGGSDIGGVKETQEMLDFCAKHNITSDIELIQMDYINTAMERLAKSDVRYRFVIDVANSLLQQ